MRSCGFCAPVLPGETCRWSLGRGPPPGICSTSGMPTARWTKSSIDSAVLAWNWTKSTTSCGASMARLCVPRAVRRGAAKGDPQEPADHALGRSRGGFSTKLHLLCDRHGHPLHFHLTAGQAHESTVLLSLLQGADASIVDGVGEPIAWPLARWLATKVIARIGSTRHCWQPVSHQ